MSAKKNVSKAYIYTLCAICVIFCAYIFDTVYTEIRSSSIPFDTDEADHANPSLLLYTSLKHGSVSGVYEAITRQAFYPPAYSIVVAANYLISGPSFSSSRSPALFCFALYTLLIFIAVYKFLNQSPGPLAAICAALSVFAAVSSPISIENSALCMLELPGILTVTLCTLAFIHYEKVKVGYRGVLLVCITALLAFFTKYNFGIMCIPATLATLYFTSNGKFFSTTRLMAPLRAAAFFTCSIALWTVLTDSSAFKHFFIGHKSYDPRFSEKNIYFELNSWLTSYCLNWYFAAGILVLALIGAWSFRKRPTVVFSFFNVAFSAFILFLSTTNEERHFMVALPSMLFLGAVGAFTLLQRLSVRGAYVVSGILAALICYFSLSSITETKTKIRAQYEGEAAFSKLFQFIYEHTSPSGPVLLYGISDDFSIEALRWYFSLQSGKLYPQIKLDAYPYRDDKNFTALMRKRNLDRPYENPQFPKKPLQKVLDKNYYSYAVHINNTSKKQRFIKEGLEMKASLASRKTAALSEGSREIEIYKLQN